MNRCIISRSDYDALWNEENAIPMYIKRKLMPEDDVEKLEFVMRTHPSRSLKTEWIEIDVYCKNGYFVCHITVNGYDLRILYDFMPYQF